MSERHILERRAHELWVAAGRPEGRDIDFWLQAEREADRSDQESPTRQIDQLGNYGDLTGLGRGGVD